MHFAAIGISEPLVVQFYFKIQMKAVSIPNALADKIEVAPKELLE